MKEKIKVIVKWEIGDDTEEGNPILFFPEYDVLRSRIGCYAFLGQHSEASMSYYNQLKNCMTKRQKEEAADLIAHYEKHFDCVLEVVKRDSKKLQKQRGAIL